jgi:hypothetical protein
MLLRRTRAFALQIGQNHGLQLFCPTSFAQPCASAKTCYAPATAQANTVLSAFIRGCSADGRKVWAGKFLPHPLSACGGERVVQRSAEGVSRLRPINYF